MTIITAITLNKLLWPPCCVLQPLPQAGQVCEDATRSATIQPLPGWGHEREVTSSTPPGRIRTPPSKQARVLGFLEHPSGMDTAIPLAVP